MPEIRGVVYAALYGVRLERRLTEVWCRELSRQLLAIRTCLSCLLSPCIDRVLSFLDAGLPAFYVCQKIPSRVRKRVALFLDDRYIMRNLLRAACLQWYWSLYVGRPDDFKGDGQSWLRVCQECSHYADFSSYKEANRDRVRSLVRNVLTDAQAFVDWRSQHLD